MKKILIVENEIAQRELLAALFQEADYSVITAQDGEEALVLACKEKPDLALLDVVLPGQNGFQICMGLRQQKETRHIKIAMYTGRALLADELKAREAGATAFWTKPLSLSHLIRKVEELLQ